MRVILPAGLSLSRQHIALAPYRVNQLGLKAGVNLAAQATDLNINHIRLWIKTIIPYRFEQHGAGHHVACVLHHMDKQTIFARLQIDKFAATLYLAADQIKRQIPYSQLLNGIVTAGPPDQRLDPGDQLGKGKGFCEVIIAARFEATNAFVHARQGAEHQHRRLVAQRAQCGKNRQAIYISRQHPVQDNNIPLLFTGASHAVRAIAADHSIVPQLIQALAIYLAFS